MNNKKETAVEWLARQLYDQMKGNDELFTNSLIQAKEMEKQQIKDAYVFGLDDEYVIGSENYYNKKYRGDTIQNTMKDHNGKEMTYWGGLAENTKETIGKDKFEKFLDAEMELGISDKKTIERIRWYYEEFFKDTIFYEQ